MSDDELNREIEHRTQKLIHARKRASDAMIFEPSIGSEGTTKLHINEVECRRRLSVAMIEAKNRNLTLDMASVNAMNDDFRMHESDVSSLAQTAVSKPVFVGSIHTV